MTEPKPEPNYDIAYFDIHVFCCINERDVGHPRGSCSRRNSLDLQGYMKSRVNEMGIGSVRINKSGCLDRCELGPVMVIYPHGDWYTYSTEQDIDEIIESHILNGERVERLALSAEQKYPLDLESRTLKLKVTKVSNETELVKRIELMTKDGKALPEFAAGAHIDIETGEGSGKSYSLAGDPVETNKFVLGVLKEPDGDGGSVWLHNHVSEGDSLIVSSPANTFPLVDDAASYILIAGGIGITPLLSMGYTLRKSGADYHLHYCTKSLEDTAFVEDVKQVFGDNVTFHHDGGDPTKGINLDSVLQKRAEGAHLYLCGPVPLMDAARKAADSWPEESVHFEYFKTPDAPEGTDNHAFDIFMTRRGEALHVPKDKTILEVLRAAGVNCASSCEAGNCGSCSTKLVSGQADHRDNVLSDEQKAANDRIMVCCSRAGPGETLLIEL